MKKLIALLLVAVMALSMAACNAAEEPGTTAATENKNETETTPAGDQITVNSALEVLEAIWAKYAEDEKFACYGGDINAPVDNAPGSAELSNTDFLTYNLLIPEAQQESLLEASSLIHMMNPNTFTLGCYAVSDVDGFATAMQAAIQGNQWMCGFPEKLIIANVNGYVAVVFGLNDVVEVFETHLNEVFSGAEILVNEAIG